MNKMEDIKLLTNEEEIKEVERLIKKIGFSIYYRNKNIEKNRSELKAVEKIKRFLEQESNKKFLENSQIWKSMLGTITQHEQQMTKNIEDGKNAEIKELAFLEQIKEKVYFENKYDYDFFNAILPYARVYGDTDHYEPALEIMMKETGFLSGEENEKE